MQIDMLSKSKPRPAFLVPAQVPPMSHLPHLAVIALDIQQGHDQDDGCATPPGSPVSSQVAEYEFDLRDSCATPLATPLSAAQELQRIFFPHAPDQEPDQEPEPTGHEPQQPTRDSLDEYADYLKAVVDDFDAQWPHANHQTVAAAANQDDQEFNQLPVNGLDDFATFLQHVNEDFDSKFLQNKQHNAPPRDSLDEYADYLKAVVDDFDAQWPDANHQPR